VECGLAASRGERSLARSRVARGLLRGREGPYRCRSRRFRAASRRAQKLTELGRAGGQSGAPQCRGGRATAERAARVRRERARIQTVRERESEGNREAGRARKREREREREREEGRDRDRAAREREEKKREHLLRRLRACLVSARLCVAASDQEDGLTGPSVWPFDTRCVD